MMSIVPQVKFRDEGTHVQTWIQSSFYVWRCVWNSKRRTISYLLIDSRLTRFHRCIFAIKKYTCYFEFLSAMIRLSSPKKKKTTTCKQDQAWTLRSYVNAMGMETCNCNNNNNKNLRLKSDTANNLYVLVPGKWQELNIWQVAFLKNVLRLHNLTSTYMITIENKYVYLN